MKVLSWLRDLVLGKNGYVPDEQDEEIQQIKDESQFCLDRASGHIQQMKGEFTKLQRKESPREEPA